ncbi:MAG TPA: outer membrane beta-barrel protein [Candidatus Saccharimonadales bacterium]|nr:outer membrane beta-barrel protein [Candidatus Saccharimonadales bacterium]
MHLTNRLLKFCSLAIFSSVALLFAGSALAQTEQTKMEVGAQFDLLKLNRFADSPTEAGIGGRFTYNFVPSLALETRYDIYPSDFSPSSAQDGGNIQTWFSGVKVTPLRREKWSVGGKVSAGLLRFGNVAVQTSATSSDFRSVSHFGTEMGGVFEYYLTPRWLVRADMGLTLINIGTRTVDIGNNGQVIAPGSLRPAFQFSLGVGYRLGELQDITEESIVNTDYKWEVAGQIATQTRGRQTLLGSTDVATEAGFGGRVTYDLLPHISLEAALTFFPRSDPDSSAFDGGRSEQLLIGVKAGVRREKLGYFVRVRPGFESFSQAVHSVTANPLETHTGSSTHGAIDFGGGVEVYTTKRTVLRFDAGDTLLFLGDASVPYANQTLTVSGGTVNSFQFSTGFGWRF